MASKEKKGRISGWLHGKERREDYAHGGIPENRFGLFWALFKGKLGRLVLANFLIVISLIPLVLVIYLRNVVVGTQGMNAVFGSGLGVGYPIIPDISGQAEYLVYRIDLIFYALMIPAAAFAALGISGGAYVMRNYIRTQGFFALKDFLQGIKRSYWCVWEALLIFTTVLFLARLGGNYADYAIATGADAAGFITLKVFAYLFVALMIPVCLWMISLGAAYRHNPWSLFRNALAMTVGTFPQSVLFAALASWPVFLTIFTSGFFQIFGMFLLVFIAFSYFLLVWTSFTQWAFDKFVETELSVATGKDAAGSEQGTAQNGKSNKKKREEPKTVLVARKRSALLSRPVQPMEDGLEIYELPQTFSREDLCKSEASKAAVAEGVKAYEDAHKNDARYVDYNREFDERERAFEELGDKNKKKKAPHRPKMLNKR